RHLHAFPTRRSSDLANNNATSSACADEALVVGKASPTIATQLSSSSITVGGTIHDSSTLTGATSDAAGTVKYRYYSTLAACNDAGNTFASRSEEHTSELQSLAYL